MSNVALVAALDMAEKKKCASHMNCYQLISHNLTYIFYWDYSYVIK